MGQSPAAKSPYEVLGVSPTASEAELKRAYRRALRDTHPDAGGSAAAFHAVQVAWQRIGDAPSRERYDTARPAQSPGASRESAPGGGVRERRGNDVRARSHGHPGGWARETYLRLVREWSGRGAQLGDPYDPALVRSAPRHLRGLLAAAIAEETTARTVSHLGIGYTIWNDVATTTPPDGVNRISHVVLGPSGLYAIRSHDWGGPVSLRRGELIGDGVDNGERPVRDLARSTRALAKQLRVRFTGQLIVVPDSDLDDDIVPVSRDGSSAVVTLSALPRVLRDGTTGGARLSVDAVFDVRTRLQRGIRFV